VTLNSKIQVNYRDLVPHGNDRICTNFVRQSDGGSSFPEGVLDFLGKIAWGC